LRSGRVKLKFIFGAAVLCAAATVVWAFLVEPGRLVTREIRMEIPQWQGELRIAVVSDVHTGSPRNGIDKLQRLVARINEERPGMIVFLGDFVTGGPRGRHPEGFVEPERIAGELRRLKAPLGVYAVLGNHDWWYNGERVGAALTSAGITVLENQAVKVPAGNPFWLGGIADLWTRNPNVPAILEQVDTADPVILLTHNPDVFPDVPPRVSLTLGAHTHGGQVQLPLWGAVVTTSQFGYNEGHFVEDGRHLFVTTGIGTSILGVRFRVPPELVMMTLAPQ
jgi:predicted MPP superfamily phosphohydrolase